MKNPTTRKIAFLNLRLPDQRAAAKEAMIRSQRRGSVILSST
jgi:hypothetical protein